MTNRILLGLSGGVDSVSLLHYLVDCGYEVTVAHVNHGIRQTAKRDEDFCRGLAEKYGCPFYVAHFDVPTLAKEWCVGIEEAGRRVRYEYFAEVMQKNGITLLATAHHKNDLAETVLFRLARGSGLSGLCGIPRETSFADGTLVRPFLDWTREEIVAYAEKNHLAWVTDETNEDIAYQRNYIRCEILPRLSLVNGGAVEHLCEVAQNIGECLDALRTLVPPISSVKELRKMPVGVQKLQLADFYFKKTGKHIPTKHLNDCLAVLRGEKKRCGLPEKRYFAVEWDKLTIYRLEKWTTDRIPFAEGETPIPGTSLTLFVKKSQNRQENITAPEENGAILYWSTYREGDTLVVGGHHRPLRRLWRERGVSLRLRKLLPVLRLGDKPVYAPHVGGIDSFDLPYQIQIEIRENHEKLN